MSSSGHLFSRSCLMDVSDKVDARRRPRPTGGGQTTNTPSSVDFVGATSFAATLSRNGFTAGGIRGIYSPTLLPLGYFLARDDAARVRPRCLPFCFSAKAY